MTHGGLSHISCYHVKAESEYRIHSDKAKHPRKVLTYAKLGKCYEHCIEHDDGRHLMLTQEISKIII